MLRRPFIASAIAIIALIIVLLLVSFVQDHKQLRSVQKELGRTDEQVVKLQKAIADQKTELDAVNKARTQLEGHFG
jgi:septal ring factor EnvC (AmiA/AmiB activator)